MKDPRIVSAGRPAFKTPDGIEHPTWNAARKHLTGLDLLETIRRAGPSLSKVQQVVLRDAILANWNVSRKTEQSNRGGDFK